MKNHKHSNGSVNRDPTEPGFFSRCEDPTREEICCASFAASLRGQVKNGTISQSEADRQLNEYRQLLEREPFGPAPQDSAAEPPGGQKQRKYRALVRHGDEDTLLKTAEILEALDAGTPLSEIEIPPGIIIEPTRAECEACCREIGIEPPAWPPPNGWRSPIFLSVRVLTHVWNDSKARLGARLVLLALADFANDAGEAWPSLASLSAKTRLSQREVRYALRNLERLGEIKTRRNKGPHGCHVYHRGCPSGGCKYCTNRGAKYNTRGANFAA